MREKLAKFYRFKGDRSLWVLSGLLALIGLLTVYSASSNLAFAGSGNTFRDLFNHGIHLIIGLHVALAVHHINYRYFGTLSRLLLPLIVLLLIYTLFFGVNIDQASRWIRIPILNQTFQTSALAAVVLMMYLARQLAKASKEELKSIRGTASKLLLPILLVVGFIMPANLSTAVLIFSGATALLFMGGYSLKNLFLLGIGGFAAAALIVVIVINFPGENSRVGTWQKRIESFQSGESAENYQVTKAKMAIAQGSISGKGPGKSALKNFLPQSNSDFIYAVIVEELGLIGGSLVVILYVWLLFRILTVANKAPSVFGQLLALGLGLNILLQAIINLSVAVNLIPVTGQTLPLVSKGGTSIWMTGFAIGLIQSVGRGSENTLLAETEETEESPESADPLIANQTEALSAHG